ncbi:MAG: DHHA1 domain-containing protein [Candidatus Aenigmatarchaeota archaeon]
MTKKYFKDLKKIKESLETDGTKMMFYHADADGVCSGVLLARYFDGFEYQSRKGPSMDNKFTNYLIEKKPDVLVFLDMPVDQEWKQLNKLIRELPKLKIIVIDHHIYEKNMNSRNIIHINPKIQEDVYIPVSYLIYKMIELFGMNVKEDIWISSIGIIGDYGIECTDVLDETRKKYPKLLGKDIFKSMLAEGAEMINSAATMRGYKGLDEVFKSLLKAHSFADFGETTKFRKWRDDVNKEVDSLLKTFEKEKKKKDSKLAEIHQDLKLIFYLLETEMSVSSTVSTLFTKKYHDEVILIIRKIEDGYKISSRCQSGRVDVAALMRKATKGIGGGGGHAKAAGAFTTDLGIFKSRVVRELKKSINK